MLGPKTTPKQIDAWRAAISEDEHLEFKEAKNQFDSDKLLRYCVALANERGGRLVLGIANKPPRPVVGTTAFLNLQRTAEHIFNNLGFRVDVEEVQHPDGRVLVFHVPPRPVGHAHQLKGSYWMRSGEALVAMTAEQLKQIFAEDKPNDPSNTSALPNRSQSVYRLLAAVIVVVIFIAGVTLIMRLGQRHGTNEKLSSGDQVTTVVRRDWRNKQNWRESLKVGMTKAEVQQLFGEAEKIDVFSNLEEWIYGSGQITFEDGSVFSWLEPDTVGTTTKPGTDSKSHNDVAGKKPSPPIVFQAPYGNLAKRCEELAATILGFVKQRNGIKPDPSAHSKDYLDWYTRNDGQFRSYFYDQAKALLRDLTTVNIKDRRLDELVTQHERYYAERNRLAPEAVFANAPMYHLSIEEIEEIGQRFKYLATQIPSH